MGPRSSGPRDDQDANLTHMGDEGGEGKSLLTMRELKVEEEGGGGVLTPRHLLDLVRAVASLHARGYVHGDIRGANVVVGLAGEVRVALAPGDDPLGTRVGLGDDDRVLHSTLIDFDWCGKPGVDTYPVDFNYKVKDVTRHGDARAGKVMEEAHDWVALANVIRWLVGNQGASKAVERLASDLEELASRGDDGVIDGVASWWGGYEGGESVGLLVRKRTGGTGSPPMNPKPRVIQESTSALSLSQLIGAGHKRSRSGGEGSSGSGSGSGSGTSDVGGGTRRKKQKGLGQLGPGPLGE